MGKILFSHVTGAPAARRARAVLALAAGLLFCAPAAAEDISNDDCLSCHDTIRPDAFASSIHGDNLCTSCHGDITEIPHPEKLKKVNCGDCHSIETEIYEASDHGKASRKGRPAATCLDCHGEPHTLVNFEHAASPVNRQNILKTCAKCHDDAEKMKPFELLEQEPVKSYMTTVHGIALASGIANSAVCTDCHGSHDLSAPSNPESKIHPKNVPQTCGKCHENVLKSYQRSIHGKASAAGKREAPVCTDCHGEHTIRSHNDPTSSVYATAVTQTCANCHAAERIVSKYRLPADRVKTHLESYHGLAGRFGVTTAANCASCHGAHDVLPSTDPRSSIHPKNLAMTCGKCHPNAGEQIHKGSVHVTPSPHKDTAVFVVTVAYIVLIVLVIGGMLLHNVLDFAAKFREHVKRERAGHAPLFNRSERIQHGILASSFITLVYTGFALKFQSAWWAVPFSLIETDVDWRGWIHRAAAAVFVALGVYHAVYAVFTPRGRAQVRALLPARKDFTDLVAKLRYHFGLSKEKPKLGHYSYIEKAEYWALIWGSIVMVITGSLLTFEDWSLRHLPKWALDVALVIHYYEAVLATLAIIVWHFYFTIFDPDHYPLHTGMMGDERKPGDRPEPPKN